MKHPHLMIYENGILKLEGDISFLTVKKIFVDAVKLLLKVEATNQVIVNLGHVTHADSAGLALLVELKRWSQKAKKNLIFQDLPEQLKLLAKVTHVESLLNLKGA